MGKQYDQRIFDGLIAIREKILKEKSTGVGDVNFLSNPNVEAERVQLEMINLVVDTSVLLSNVSTRTGVDCKGQIMRLDTCDIVAKGACVDCDPRVSFTDSYIPYDLKKYMAEWRVPFDFLECNKMGTPQQVMDELTAMWLTQLRNNLELAAIYGDEALPTGQGQTPWNNLMGINDGWLKIACECTPECQIIDAGGAGPSPTLFHNAMAKLPVKYRANQGDYEFISGPVLKAWYAKYRSERSTEIADGILTSGEASSIWGTDFFTVPMWREDLDYNSGAQQVTHILYARRSNMLHLSGREFQIESERKIKCDATDFTAYWKSDVIWQRPEEVVIIKNVDLCGTPYIDCVNAVCDPCGYVVANPAVCCPAE